MVLVMPNEVSANLSFNDNVLQVEISEATALVCFILIMTSSLSILKFY